MFSSLNRSLIPLALLAGFMTSPSWAQNDASVWGGYKDIERKPAANEPPPEPGWHRSLLLNGNLSFTSSQNVVGQVDGSSQTYGVNSKASLNHFGEQSEWRNDLFVRGATTRTPAMGRFVKSEDELKIASIYLHRLEKYPNVGPYARGEASAPIFKGEDTRSENTTYNITYLDPSRNTTRQGTTLRLTDGFRPLTTKEAAGFFYRPFTEDNFKVETRLGIAASQIRAAGQFTVAGQNAQKEILVKELDDVMQAGVEAGLLIKGKLDEKTNYELGADAMTPFVTNKKAGDKRSALELTNVETYFKLVSKITPWASFGYDYKMRLQPQLIERAQQIHMLVINLTYASEGKF